MSYAGLEHTNAPCGNLDLRLMTVMQAPVSLRLPLKRPATRTAADLSQYGMPLCLLQMSRNHSYDLTLVKSSPPPRDRSFGDKR